MSGEPDSDEPRVSVLEAYDDPDPEVRVLRLAAAQRDHREGWIVFSGKITQHAAKQLERAGVLASAKARDVRAAPVGRAYRLVH